MESDHMKGIKICSAALAMLFLLTGCGSSAKDLPDAPGSEALPVSEAFADTAPENPYNTESFSAPASGDDTKSDTAQTESESEVNEMRLTVNGTEFNAEFLNTKAAEEFKAMLPLTLDMSELNGNEKYFYLDGRLTADSENVGKINSGDIMLYGSNCIVLFYESFSTPYSYTRIGKIKDPDGLKNAVGKGGVTVEFKG